MHSFQLYLRMELNRSEKGQSGMTCWPHPWMSWSLPVSKKLQNFEWGVGVPSFGGRKLDSGSETVVGSSYDTLSFGRARKSQDAVSRNEWVLSNAEQKLTWMLREPESFPFIWSGAAPWTDSLWLAQLMELSSPVIDTVRERPSWDARRVFKNRSSPLGKRLTVYLYLFLFSKTKQ